MTEIIKALSAFIFGLTAKIIYDVWKEKRIRKSLLIAKSFEASFSSHSLAKPLRQATKVLYEGHPVSSIKVACIEIQNTGTSAIRNQAVTVRFDDDARILGEPTSDSSSEDLRHVQIEDRKLRANTQRFLIRLLRRGRSIRWTLPVIDHPDADFVVEHGIALEQGEEGDVDLDVTATVVMSTQEAGLAGKLARIVTWLVLLQVVSLTTTLASARFHEPVLEVGSAFIVLLWFLFLRESYRAIQPLLQWIERRTEMRFSSSVYVEDIRTSGDVTIAGKDLVHQREGSSETDDKEKEAEASSQETS